VVSIKRKGKQDRKKMTQKYLAGGVGVTKCAYLGWGSSSSSSFAGKG